MDYQNMQDNIYPELYNMTTQGVLDWIKENRDQYDWAKQPNAYEMTNLFLLGAKYRQEGQAVNLDTLEEMWKIRSQDFKDMGIGENNFVYVICKDSIEAAKKGEALVNDPQSHHALRKMAGMGLYLEQQRLVGKQRDYNNPQEFSEFLDASSVLQKRHPRLFEKYRFMDNIKTMGRIQKEHGLPDELALQIEELEEQVGKEEREN